MGMSYIGPDGVEVEINTGLGAGHVQVQDFEVSPDTRDLPVELHTIWAATNDGVAITSNGGILWDVIIGTAQLGEPVNTAADAPAPTSAELAQDSITVWSATEAYLVRSKTTATPTERTWIYHSTDAGQTWTNFQLGIVCPDPELMPSTWAFNVTVPISFNDIEQIVNTGTAFYFNAGDSNIWEWDGNTFTQIQFASNPEFLDIDFLVAFKGDLYATGRDGSSDRDIYKWDGTPGDWTAVLEQSTFQLFETLSSNGIIMVASATTTDESFSVTFFTSNGSSWSPGSWNLADVEHSDPTQLSTFDRSDRRIGRTFFDQSDNRYFEFVGSQWLNRVIDPNGGFQTTLFFTTESGDLVWTLPVSGPATWTDNFVDQNEPTQPVGNDVFTTITISNYAETFGGQEDSDDQNLYIFNASSDAWDFLEVVPDSFPGLAKGRIGNIGGITYFVLQSSDTFDLVILERADPIPTI